MAHRNARLTVHGRTVLVERVLSGRPVAHVAAELGVSCATGYKWWARYRREGLVEVLTVLRSPGKRRNLTAPRVAADQTADPGAGQRY
jgi:transposase